MKIGVRKSPHLDAILQGLALDNDVQLVSEYDTGADFYLCWGWPQAEQVARDNGGSTWNIICIDAHPFALMAGDKSGDRILQLGNWGFLAAYPKLEPEAVKVRKGKAKADGPVLVLGHVDSTEQRRKGYVDVWRTPGGDAWLREELAKEGRKLRQHPRMWTGEGRQPSLADELEGCSRALAWNSTAVIHARLLGYQADTIEPHGWGLFDLERLASLRVSPAALRDGTYWSSVYRPWLESLQKEKARA